MENRVQDMINSLTDVLHQNAEEFLLKNLNEYEETNTVVTLLLSGFISGLISTLKTFIRQYGTDPRNIAIMDGFCMDILQSIQQIDHVIDLKPLIDCEH